MKRCLGIIALVVVVTCVKAQDSLRLYQLEQVVVTGTRDTTPSSRLPLSIIEISQKQLTQDYRTSVLPTLMEQTPGLFNTSRGVMGYGVSTGSAGSIKVRGVGGGAQLLVLIDGQPQYVGLMGHPVADVYQTMMAEKVEVVRGPASLYYGSNAMAGVVNIITRQQQERGVKTMIDLSGGLYGTAEANAVNTTHYGGFSSVVGLNYQRTSGHRANSDYEQYGGYAKLGYDISNNWKVQGDVNVTHFNASNPGTVSDPIEDNDAHVTRGLASGCINNDYGVTSGSLRGYYDWGEHTIDDGYKEGELPTTSLYHHKDYIAGITWYQSAKLFKGNRTTVGLDWQHFGGSAWYADKETGEKSWMIKDENGEKVESVAIDEVGVYIDFRQEICKWLSIDAGVRADWHSITGLEWVPAGGLAFHVTKDDDIKAMVGKGFRNPTLKEMYLFASASPDLKQERMMNYEVAYTHRFEGKGQVGVNVFYLQGSNLIETIMIDGRPKNVNHGEFQHWGFELTGQYQLNDYWAVNGNYSYLWMKSPVIGAPESKLYVGMQFHKGRWGANVGLQQIAGLYLSTGEDAVKENYTLLNATFSCQALKWMCVFIKGDNLLAQKYQTYLGYPMPRIGFMGGLRFAF